MHSFIPIFGLIIASLYSSNNLQPRHDPFGCNGSDSCNLAALRSIIRSGKITLSYAEAREKMFQYVDEKVINGERYVKSVYTPHLFQLPPTGIPQNGVNCEHTMPQSVLKNYSSYHESKTDLHHLFPVEARANSSRGNRKFAECPEDSQTNLILCEGFAEPPIPHKGAAARALIYVSVYYNIRLNGDEEIVVRAWNSNFPPTPEELERNRRVEDVQGNINPFVTNPEYVDLIKDL